jgi:glucose-1-phosphate adenylyltransferase
LADTWVPDIELCSAGALAGELRQTQALVLADGSGAGLHELTCRRAKAAVPFAGTGRIIDFALANALNSGIRRIGIATQYKAHSLIQHLQQSWTFLLKERNESFDILPASQRIVEGHWYRGTADAVFQNLDILENYGARHVLVLAGDHIYRMDYGPMLAHHLQSGADVTVGCIEMPRAEAGAHRLVRINGTDRIAQVGDGIHDDSAPSDLALVSMGIYLFDAARLYSELRRDAAERDSSHDFGRDLIPYLAAQGRAVAYNCARSEVDPALGYWRDLATLDAYFAASLDLTSMLPVLDLYDHRWPIWTTMDMRPPAKFVHDADGRRGTATNSLVANGCIVSGAHAAHSLLSTNVRVRSFAELDRAMVLPGAEIGRGARLQDVIVDSRVQIPPGLVVGEDPELDARRFRRTEKGVSLITQSMIDQLH